jgi:hypothetical protein
VTLSPGDKAARLADIREAATSYFEDRDRLDASKDVLVDLIAAANEQGLTQQEIADGCDLRDVGTAEWTFHRTRIQQFIAEARAAAGA